MKKWFFYIIAILCFSGTIKTRAQVGVSVQISIAPPAIPVYIQPVCPVEGYLWIPGYWAYGPDGYYWVPGFWIHPPRIGFLWTPGYWAFTDGFYFWHAGYWGPHIGFYGGINYGFGYYGTGFCGGRWENGVFSYNRAVFNVNAGYIHNTYEDRTVINTSENHTAFNGKGGINIAPTHEEETAMKESHIEPTKEQLSNERSAGTNRNQLYKVNGGHPAAAAIGPSAGQRNAFNKGSMKSNNKGPAAKPRSQRVAPVGTSQPNRKGMQPLGNNPRQGGQQMQRGNIHRQGGGQRQYNNNSGGGQPQRGGGNPGGRQQGPERKR